MNDQIIAAWSELIEVIQNNTHIDEVLEACLSEMA
jgi:hypothetical protein